MRLKSRPTCGGRETVNEHDSGVVVIPRGRRFCCKHRSLHCTQCAICSGGRMKKHTVLHSKRVDFEHGVISAVFPSHTCNYIVLFW